MFFNFHAHFSKCTFLRMQHFFLPSTYPIRSIWSVIQCIYKIHVFNVIFLHLGAFAMINEKCLSPISIATIVREMKSSITFLKPIDPLSLKKRSHTDRYYSKKLSQRCDFYHIAKTPDPSNRNKMQQKLPFLIFNTICHIPVWVWFVKHVLYPWVHLMFTLDILRAGSS